MKSTLGKIGLMGIACGLSLSFFVGGCSPSENAATIDSTKPAETEKPVETVKEDAGAQDGKYRVVFEMPENWEVKENSAYLYEEPKDSSLGSVEVEVYAKRGTEEEAKGESLKNSEADIANGGSYREDDLNGKKIFISELRTDQAMNGLWWSNEITFAKDGWIYSVWMTDRIENQKEAITKLVETVRMEPVSGN